MNIILTSKNAHRIHASSNSAGDDEQGMEEASSKNRWNAVLNRVFWQRDVFTERNASHQCRQQLRKIENGKRETTTTTSNHTIAFHVCLFLSIRFRIRFEPHRIRNGTVKIRMGFSLLCWLCQLRINHQHQRLILAETNFSNFIWDFFDFFQWKMPCRVSLRYASDSIFVWLVY